MAVPRQPSRTRADGGRKGRRRRRGWTHLSLRPRLSRLALQAQGSAVRSAGAPGPPSASLANPTQTAHLLAFLSWEAGHPRVALLMQNHESQQQGVSALGLRYQHPPPCIPPTPDACDAPRRGKGRRWYSPHRRGDRSSLGSPAESKGLDEFLHLSSWSHSPLQLCLTPRTPWTHKE